MPTAGRFVVLRHSLPQQQARGDHWDFMLEADGVLLTWALPAEPRTGAPQTAERLADHRLAYLDYEGPISGDRGSVTRWDRGEWTAEGASDFAASEEIVLRLRGEKLIGRVTLRRESPSDSQADAAHWWRIAFLLDLPTRGSGGGSASA